MTAYRTSQEILRAIVDSAAYGRVATQVSLGSTTFRNDMERFSSLNAAFQELIELAIQLEHTLRMEQGTQVFETQDVQPGPHHLRIGYLAAGSIDIWVDAPNIDTVKEALTHHVSDHEILRGIDNDGLGMDEDQIIIRKIESIPTEKGEVTVFYKTK